MAPSLRPLPLHEGVYGLAANLIVFVGVSVLTAPHARSRLAHYAPVFPQSETAP